MATLQIRRPYQMLWILCVRSLLLSAFGSPFFLGAAEIQRSLNDNEDWEQARQFWAFQAPHSQPLPALKNRSWPRQRLDHFIMARLEKENLAPSPAVPNLTLIRRLTFDLTGLPPSPEEIRAFLDDEGADAYQRLVDRLLNSPRFGERLASMWLNAARYAEDQAHQVGDDNAGFYPNAYQYRQWVIGAFNRDLPYDQFIKLQLAADTIAGVAKEDRAALGFVGLGPKYYNRGRLEVMADEWEDRVDTVTRSFLGLTVACARCHDHKYDPITTEDYYGLAGVFASTKLVNRTADGKAEEPEDKKEKKKKEPKVVDPNILHVVEDGQVQDLNVFVRGNVAAKGPVAPRRFLRVLCQGEPVPFQQGSGRNELAEAIGDVRNPLTARVMVNRIWGTVFGRPLVGTPSNFGNFGDRPTHPELLDDLAVRFMRDGWSIKRLVREMVLSSTYRQSSHHQGPQIQTDSENRLWWRMNRRRLTIEQWRDAILFVADDLEWAGGKSLELDDPNNHRRTVYGRVSRLKLNDLLMLYDYPDANVHSDKRPVTTTATQKLFVLNSPFIITETKALAARLQARSEEGDATRIDRAYQLLYGRPARDSEKQLGLEFLSKEDEAGMSRWERYAQVLLAANEMMYVD